MKKILITCLVLATTTVAPVARSSAEEASGDEWQITIAPYAWLTSLDGNVTVQGQKADADADFFGDILDQIGLAGMVLVDIQRRRWAFSANFVGARLESDNNNIDTKEDIVNFGVGLTYFAIDHPRDPEGGIGYRFGPSIGARYTYLRAEVDVKNFRTFDSTKQWVDPLVGARGALDLSDRFGIVGAADVGGFGVGSDYSWNAQIYGLYETSVFGVPTALSLGYRVLHQNYDSGNFEYDVTTYGPIIGAAFTF